MKNKDLNEWIHRDELCKKMNITQKTLSNYICNGRIPQKAVGKGIMKKMFHIPSLLNNQ